MVKNVLIDGHRLAYGVYDADPPVVLLHGTPSSSLIWRNLMPRLVEAGHRVQVYNLLGYGLSKQPWDPAVDTSITGHLEHQRTA